MQNIPCEMPGWKKHKLESRLPGEISTNLRYTDDTTLMAESEEELKSLLTRVKEESEKAGLKLNIWKTKIMKYYQFSSVQSLSHVQLFATLWTAPHQASLSITNSWNSPTHVHRVGDAIQPSHPL